MKPKEVDPVYRSFKLLLEKECDGDEILSLVNQDNWAFEFDPFTGDTIRSIETISS